MARTKQTARRTTGRKAPRKILASKKTRKTKAEKRAEKSSSTSSSSEEDSDSSLSSARSLSEAREASAGAHAGDENSGLQGETAASTTSTTMQHEEAREVSYSPITDEEDAHAGDEHSGLQEGLAASTMSTTMQNEEAREFSFSPITDEEEAEDQDMEPTVPGQQDLTASQSGTVPTGAAGEVRHDESGHVPDPDEGMRVGVLITNATLWGRPSTYPETHGEYFSAYVDLRNSHAGGMPLADTAGITFGALDHAHRKLLASLLGQTPRTGFHCRVRLAPLSVVKDNGDWTPRDVMANIVMVALRHAVDEICNEIKERGFHLHPNGSRGSQRDTTAQTVAPSVTEKDPTMSQGSPQDANERSDFQAEASKHKAESRLNREEDFEPTHPAKTSMSRAATAYQSKLKAHQSKAPAPLQGSGALLTTTSKPAPENAQSTRGWNDNMPSASATAANEASEVARLLLEDSGNERDVDASALSMVVTTPGVVAPAQTKPPAVAIPGLATSARDTSQPTSSANVPLQHTSAQAAYPKVQHQIVGSTSSVTDENVADFLEDTDTTSEEAARQYILAHGTVRLAVRQFIKDQKALILKEATPSRIQPAPPTLLEEALHAHLTDPERRERQLHGDTVVILDGAELGRICRLSFSDLRKASKLFDAELNPPPVGSWSGDTWPEEVQGVRHLYILLQPIDGQMPKLMHKKLSTMRKDCAQDIFQRAENTAATRSSVASGLDRSEHVSTNLKQEDDGTTESTEPPTKSMDSQAGYEDFFCLVSRFRPKFCEAKDIANAIDPLEAVAEIANYYNAVHSTSEVTARLNDMFNRFVIERQLWQSVAADASRWLMIAVQLRNVPIFKEAFVHLAGSYPDWLGSVPQTDFPSELMEAIEIKSSMLREERIKIERKLMFTTLSGYSKDYKRVLPVSQQFRPSTYNVVNVWSDWIRTHLALLDDESFTAPNPTPICKHDDEECLSLAGFYSKVSLGGGYYLPVNDVIKKWHVGFSIHNTGTAFKRPEPNHPDWENVRADLASLKKKASELVAPLVKRNLEYKEKLKYLTCIEVEESDFLWEKE